MLERFFARNPVASSDPHMPPAPISDEVVSWLLLLRSEHATQEDLHAFQQWRAQDTRHEQAWQQLARALGSTFGRLEQTFPPSHEAPEAAASRASRRAFIGRSMALAASIAAVAAMVNEFYPLENIAADQATMTGERRRVALADGSEVLLDARTRINLAFTHQERRVELLEGAIVARVAPDSSRPFTIQTAQGNVRALGTRYMVRQELRRSLVVVDEHEVEIFSSTGARGTVRAGMGTRFDDSRVDLPRADLHNDSSWQHGLVRVENRPLLQVISALRPYRPGELRISVAAGALPVTGQFPLDDSERSLAMLAQSLPIRIFRVTPWYVSIDVA
jgi:transmembrane sensor